MTNPLRCKSISKRILGIVALLLATAVLCRADASQDVKKAKPNSKDKAEWVNAGFKFGWMNLSDDGRAFFHDQQAIDGLPVFRFTRFYKRLNLTSLPVIGVPFGLVLDDPSVDDRFLEGVVRFQEMTYLCLKLSLADFGLKQVSKLRNLVRLDLSTVDLSNEAIKSKDGLRHFAPLTKLEVLNLSNTKCEDNAIENLGEMKELRVLNLQQTSITDAGLKKVANFTRLQVLNVLYTPITRKGIKELASLPDLRSLSVGGPTIADAEISEIAKLRQLNSLEIVLSQIGHDGLKTLVNLEKLQTLDLSLVRTNDDDLKELTNLKHLQSLSLAGAPITNVGLKTLSTLNQLKDLNVAGTKITDAGLEALTGLKELRTLDVRETKVTRDGIDRLKNALPKVTIVFDKGGF
jgi:internalin A